MPMISRLSHAASEKMPVSEFLGFLREGADEPPKSAQKFLAIPGIYYPAGPEGHC